MKKIRQFLARVTIWIALLILLTFLLCYGWQAIGGPQYIICLVESIEPGECSLGMP